MPGSEVSPSKGYKVVLQTYEAALSVFFDVFLERTLFSG